MEVGKYKIPERSMDERMARWAKRQKVLFTKLRAVVEHIATDGAEITPELVNEAKFILRNWYTYKKID